MIRADSFDDLAILPEESSLSTPTASTSSLSTSPSSSVYTNPQYLNRNQRNISWGVSNTGNDFKKLQKRMAVPHPTGNLRQLPTHGIHDLLACVLCGDIPLPGHCLVCEENNHRICDVCAARVRSAATSMATAASGEGLTGSMEGDESRGRDTGTSYSAGARLKPCCAPANLRKESPVLMKALFAMSMWKCPNYWKGCPAVFPSAQWDQHQKTCQFQTAKLEPGKCFCHFQQCSAVMDRSLEEVLHHYKGSHGADISYGWQFEVPVDYRKSTEKRLLTVFRFTGIESGPYFLVFACQVCRATDTMHIWVWCMDFLTNNNEGNRGTAEVMYRLKLVQVRDHPDVRTEDLILEETCIPYGVSAEKIMKKEKSHFRMDLGKFSTACVESTPNGHGRWNVSLKFDKI